MKEITLKVNGMACEGCENRIKNALSTIENVEGVTADHKTGIVTVTSKEEIKISEVEEKISDIGFEVVKED